MRIKVKELFVIIMYIIMFVSALSYMRFANVEANIYFNIHMLAMLSLDILCLLYIFFSFSGKNAKIDRFSILLFLFLCHEVATSSLNSLLNLRFFIDALPWPLLLIVFVNYFKTNDLPKSFPIISVLGITLVVLFSIPNIIKHVNYYDGDAIFTTFYSIAFLPMVFLTCSKKISNIYSFIVTLVMLFTLKRSAFLIVTFGLMVYSLVKKYIESGKGKNIRKYISYFAFVIIFVFFLNYIIDTFNLSILTRLENSLEDSGSGRLFIWNEVFMSFINSSFIDKLFGHGFHSVYYYVQPLGKQRYAHNSFLETLYDYGFVGLLLLLCIISIIVIKSIKMIREKNKLAPVMFYTLVPMMVLGLVSYFFEESSVIIPICTAWGLCLGKFSRERKLIKK